MVQAAMMLAAEPHNLERCRIVMMVRITGCPITVRDLTDGLALDLAPAHGTDEYSPRVDGLRIPLLPGFDGELIGNAPLRLARVLNDLRNLGFGLRLRLGAAGIHARLAIVSVPVLGKTMQKKLGQRLHALAGAAALPDLGRPGGVLNEPLLAGESVLFCRCTDTRRAFCEPSAGAMGRWQECCYRLLALAFNAGPQELELRSLN
jgi:hypothetical protein